MSETVARRLGVKVLVSDERKEIEGAIDGIEQDLLNGNLKQDTTYFLQALSKVRSLRKLMQGNDDE